MQDIRYAIRSLRKRPILRWSPFWPRWASRQHRHLQPAASSAPAAASVCGSRSAVFVFNTYPDGIAAGERLDSGLSGPQDQAPAIEDATLFTFRPLSLATQGQPDGCAGSRSRRPSSRRSGGSRSSAARSGMKTQAGSRQVRRADLRPGPRISAPIVRSWDATSGERRAVSGHRRAAGRRQCRPLACPCSYHSRSRRPR